ncbi:MAG: hypothetical protein JNJ54_35725 [Myxococcaceae bacterium]|nr:hypothetical protein [Myxococcaceae bacterium]
MASSREQRRKSGLFPAQDVDVTTALELLEWSWYRFARSTEAATPEVVRGVLAGLEAWVAQPARSPGARERRKAASLFLRAAVDETDDGRLRATWRAAVNALKVFESQYAWGSKEKATRLADARSDARLVEAARAAAVGSTVVPLELLAVLAMEGSEASADALMPHVERALTNEAHLEPLSRLGRYAAKTKAMTGLLGLVESRLDAARGASPVMVLAKSLGLASGARFRVEVRVPGRGVTACFVSLDSARPGPAFSGWVQGASRDQHRMLHREDGTTVCALPELPAWLARAAEELGTTWRFDAVTSSHLRGKRLGAFLAWLAGG